MKHKKVKTEVPPSRLWWHEEKRHRPYCRGEENREFEASSKVIFYSCIPSFCHLLPYAESISLDYCKTILQFISSLPNSPWGCPSHAARAHPAANTIIASQPPVHSLLMMFCHIKYHSTVAHCSISFLNYSFAVFSSSPLLFLSET